MNTTLGYRHSAYRPVASPVTCAAPSRPAWETKLRSDLRRVPARTAMGDVGEWAARIVTLADETERAWCQERGAPQVPTKIREAIVEIVRGACGVAPNTLRLAALEWQRRQSEAKGPRNVTLAHDYDGLEPTEDFCQGGGGYSRGDRWEDDGDSEW